EYLETELYKKLSFPLVTLIMTVLGVPFSLTMGRKGALYGIAAGVLIGIIYWGAFGVFDVLGSSGLLAPSLAAWGPNILFGTGAVLLLSGVKT
ncbi:MAG TPA: LptF/LptG family permease, partial [Acidobacteriota bacterium]|nr:LptF/LptG family permease [Acidobacteriota bacterium]